MNDPQIKAESKGLSVKKAMTLNSLVVGGILLTVIAVSVLVFRLRDVHSLVQEKSRAGTEMICLLSMDALIAEDRPVLDTVVSGLESLETGLVSVQLLNPDGEELASWTRDGSEEVNAVHTVQPIIFKGLDFGTAKMSWSYQYFAAPIIRNVIENCILIFAAGFVLIVSMIAFAQRILVKPIEYLDEKVRSIAIYSTPPMPDFRLWTKEFRNLNGSLDLTAKVLADKARDKSRIIRAEEQARSARESAKAKMDFLSLMSHEIRTPLGVIIGFSKLLGEADLPEEDQNYVKNINQSGEFLLQIVNDILDLSKIEANGLQLDPAAMKITDLCEAMKNMMAPTFGDRPVKFAVECNDLMNQWVIGDQHRLKQVLMNLVGNASKFTDKGSVTLTVKPLKEEEDGKIRVRFSVSDTGVGMTKETVAKIFSPFSQADNSVSRKHGGTGLGLTISNQLVNLMGSEIEVESEPGEGSEFSFDIDMITTEPPAVSEEEITEVLRKVENDDLRILVVEDEKMNRVLMEKVFRKIGFEVEFAEDGQVCVDLLEDGEKYDVVFLDVHLPGVGGLDIAQKIRAGDYGRKMANVNMAVMSADIFCEAQCEDIGVDAIISKPVNFADLKNFLDPLRSGANAPRKRVKKKPRVDPRGSKLNVLVVEDQLLNQQLIGKVCDHFGIQPVYASDGLQCLEHLAADSTVDAILLDLRMPRMDGLTVAQKIRGGEAGAAYKDIPIAVISAEIFAIDDCTRIGVDEFIPKPLDIELLRKFVNKVEKGSSVALPA